MASIRFRFAASKALAAIHWMLLSHRPIDLHAVLKTCYFADKKHLNEFDRPIFGATYRAMKFGPVPLEIYEMLKGESLWLAELGIEKFPWRLLGYQIALDSNSEPNLESLAESDISVLSESLERSHTMSFNERTAATHGPDWQAAELGIMRYEDMIEERNRERLIPYLQERSRIMRL